MEGNKKLKMKPSGIELPCIELRSGTILLRAENELKKLSIIAGSNRGKCTATGQIEYHTYRKIDWTL